MQKENKKNFHFLSDDIVGAFSEIKENPDIQREVIKTSQAYDSRIENETSGFNMEDYFKSNHNRDVERQVIEVKDKVKLIELDKYEHGILINALNEFRNKNLKLQHETGPIEELMLKVINAPEKKGFRKFIEVR